jgi:hypothetical protein
MANPFDITSGYLAAQELKEKRKQAEELKEYRAEAIKLQRDEATSNSGFKNRELDYRLTELTGNQAFRQRSLENQDREHRGNTDFRLASLRNQSDELSMRRPYFEAQADALRLDAGLVRGMLRNPTFQKVFGAAFDTSEPESSSSGNAAPPPNKSAGNTSSSASTSGNSGTRTRSLTPSSGDYSYPSTSVIKVGSPYASMPSSPPLVIEDNYITPQDYLGKADGTPGAVDLDRISAIQAASNQPLDSLASDDRLEAIPVAGVQARKPRVNASSSPANAAIATPDAQASGASGEPVQTPLETVAQLDPRRAASITKEVFGASRKEFNQMLGAFGALNVVRGKSTPQSLLEMTAAMDTLRKEGVEKAVLRALNGDSAGALKAFDESGEFDAKDIKKIGTFKINNPVQGAGKLTDTYDGVLVQFNNGPDLKIDPRKLAAERKGLEWLLTFNENKEKAMRDDNRMTQANANSTESNRLRNDELKFQREVKNDNDAMSRIGADIRSMRSNEYSVWVGANGGIEEKLSEDAKRRKLEEIDNKLNTINSIAGLNIRNGNRNVDTGTISQYLPYLKPIQGSDDPALQFWNNPENFARDQNGKLLAKTVNGRLLVQTNDGVILPRPIPPRQGAIPARPGVVDPRLDPGN